MRNIEFSLNQNWLNWQNKKDLDSENIFYSAFEEYPPAFSSDFLSINDLGPLLTWAKMAKESFNFLIVIGIGGSSLGGKAILECIGDESSVVFWEGSHPAALYRIGKRLEKESAAALVISKSGKTFETLTNLNLLRQFFPETPVWFVTSEPDQVIDFCENSSKIFHIPKELGGRFSIVSPAGILPGLFAEADMKSFIKGFTSGVDHYGIDTPLAENTAKSVALNFRNFADAGFTNVVFWNYTEQLRAAGDWLIQLWAESLGKHPSFRLLPISAYGPEDQHSQLQFFMESGRQFIHIFISTDSYGAIDTVVNSSKQYNLSQILNAQRQSIQIALNNTGLPIADFRFAHLDTWHLGRWVSFWMFVVTYLGYLFKVNPFDQPGVEAGKEYCRKILDEGYITDIYKSIKQI